MPIVLPVGLLGWLFNSAAVAARWLDVDSGSFAAFLLRGTVSGIFWGGCVLYPLGVYRRTKLKPYKHFAIAFSVYAFIVLVLSAIFFLMLANSGWTD